MNILKTDIPDLLILEPRVFGDSRGYFFESFSERDFKAATAFDVKFVQDNESRSCYGVVRGLHFQKGEHAQAKLVRVVEGEVLDVAVDLRHGSPTFGKHAAVLLSGENHRQLFIPKGFAHGFAVLSETAVFQYKCDEFYHPEAEGGIAWNDPDIAIQWPIPIQDIILSERDNNHPNLKDFNSPFLY